MLGRGLWGRNRRLDVCEDQGLWHLYFFIFIPPPPISFLSFLLFVFSSFLSTSLHNFFLSIFLFHYFAIFHFHRFLPLSSLSLFLTSSLSISLVLPYFSLSFPSSVCYSCLFPSFHLLVGLVLYTPVSLIDRTGLYFPFNCFRGISPALESSEGVASPASC